MQQLTKPTLLAVTHAMEDEYLAAAEPAVLFGAFQRATLRRPVLEPLARPGPRVGVRRRARRLR